MMLNRNAKENGEKLDKLIFRLFTIIFVLTNNLRLLYHHDNAVLFDRELFRRVSNAIISQLMSVDIVKTDTIINKFESF